MQKTVTSQDVVDQFAAAFELLLIWMEQRSGTTNTKPVEAKPFRRIDDDTILNAVEVSNILGVSLAYVYKLMKQNLVTRQF